MYAPAYFLCQTNLCKCRFWEIIAFTSTMHYTFVCIKSIFSTRLQQSWNLVVMPSFFDLIHDNERERNQVVC